MKKLLVIALFAASTIGVAATIKKVNNQPEAKQLPAETVNASPRTSIVSNWD